MKEKKTLVYRKPIKGNEQKKKECWHNWQYMKMDKAFYCSKCHKIKMAF